MLIAAMVILVFFLALIGFLIRKWRQEADIPVEPVPVEPPREHFVVKPYIQLGTPGDSRTESLEIIWHTADIDAFWEVETGSGNSSKWRWEQAPTMRRLEFAGMPAQRRYTVAVTGLFPGEDFDYRLLKHGEVVFASSARARKSFFEQYRFAVVGDIGSGSDGQKKTAHQMASTKPDFVCMPGDVAYDLGRVSDYLTRFFPIYNADESSPATGAPLMRSTLFVASPGNHDMGMPYEGDVPDLDKYPDLHGYFIFWSLPLNGPVSTRSGVNVPALVGSEQRKSAFLAAAGNAYPRMASYSFQYANSHWTMVDANDYMDMSDSDLRSWLEKDLSSAAAATWKFVCIHQPGFTTDKGHRNEQRMRLLVDIFQKYAVDMVFSGHAHWYERSYPLRFTAEGATGGRLSRKHGVVPGALKLDRDFDGVTRTKPDGILYVTSGAGGGRVKPYRLPQSPDEVQPFTYKWVGDRHSFTVCDVYGGSLTVRQISEDGEEIDRFTVTK